MAERRKEELTANQLEHEEMATWSFCKGRGLRGGGMFRSDMVLVQEGDKPSHPGDLFVGAA